MNLKERISKLEAAYNQPSSLSGALIPEKQDNDPLATRIAHLNPMEQEAIKNLSAMQHGHPLVAYETEDGKNAGIICRDSFRKESPDVFNRFSQLFFGIHHSVICMVFRDELRTMGRQYREKITRKVTCYER